MSLLWLVAVLVVIGCVPIMPPLPSPSFASPSPEACLVTDQVNYVYHPSRLKVLAACLRVTGTIWSMKGEPDGDYHIRLTVDPPYADLINDVNVSGQHGKLVVEPVCERTVTQTDAQAICATDAHPIDLNGIHIGEHVWMEGQFVSDLQHGGWNELHPLTAWGEQP